MGDEGAHAQLAARPCADAAAYGPGARLLSRHKATISFCVAVAVCHPWWGSGAEAWPHGRLSSACGCMPCSPLQVHVKLSSCQVDVKSPRCCSWSKSVELHRNLQTAQTQRRRLGAGETKQLPRATAALAVQLNSVVTRRRQRDTHGRCTLTSSLLPARASVAASAHAAASAPSSAHYYLVV